MKAMLTCRGGDTMQVLSRVTNQHQPPLTSLVSSVAAAMNIPRYVTVPLLFLAFARGEMVDDKVSKTATKVRSG